METADHPARALPGVGALRDPGGRRGVASGIITEVEEADLTRIWNRATTGATLGRPGDQALHHALRVHGQVMNAGLLSALDYIDYEEIERGAAGFEYLGMQQEADTLRTALELAFPDGPVR